MAGRRKGWRDHEGVSLIRKPLPSGGVRWLVRYVDPDSLKTKYETVPPEYCTREEQRLVWAEKKAEALTKRGDELDAGGVRKKEATFEDAVARYYTDVATGLRPATLKVYQAATDNMLDWARRKGIKLTDDVRGEHLASLRTWLVNKPGMRQARGGRVETGKGREVWSVNRDIRGIKACLEHLRRVGLLPFVSHDSIRDNMKTLRAPKPVPEYLKPSALQKLVAAARRHDEDVFLLTREEKAQGLAEGSTPKYGPILPYLALLLLSGMRADEGRLLKWDQVDLDAAPAGTVTLQPQAVKTHHGRMVDLVVSPLLADLLASMKLRAGESVYVFGDAGNEPALTRFIVEAARKRITRKEQSKTGTGFGGPRFSWKQLRVTCATFLTNAPGIFGAASAYRSARQLGHSVKVAETHYLGVVHVAPEAKTLEAAMGIEKELREALGLDATKKTRHSAQLDA